MRLIGLKKVGKIDKKENTSIRRLPYIIIAALSGGMLVALFAAEMVRDTPYDPPNLSTLVVEIVLAIIVSYTVYLYSKQQYDENSDLLENMNGQQYKMSSSISELDKTSISMHDNLDRIDRIRAKREWYVTQELGAQLKNLQNILLELKEDVEAVNSQLDEVSERTTITKIEYLTRIKNEELEKIRIFINFSETPTDFIGDSNEIIQVASTLKSIKNTIPNVNTIEDALEKLEKLIEKINRHKIIENPEPNSLIKRW